MEWNSIPFQFKPMSFHFPFHTRLIPLHFFHFPFQFKIGRNIYVYTITYISILYICMSIFYSLHESIKATINYSATRGTTRPTFFSVCTLSLSLSVPNNFSIVKKKLQYLRVYFLGTSRQTLYAQSFDDSCLYLQFCTE